MKHFLKIGVMVTSIMLTSLTAHASQPSEASLQQLNQVMNIDNLAKKMLSPNPEKLNSLVRSLSINDSISADKQQQVQQIIRKYIQKIYQEMDTPENRQIIVDSFMDANRKHYNQQEIDAQIAFYSTEVGQGIIDKQTDVTLEFMSGLVPIHQAQTKALQNVMPDLFREVYTMHESTD